jgi:predicted transposase/invertase (TIGR01784 family)
MDKQNDNENNLTVDKINDKFFWDIYGRPINTAGFLKDFLPSNILNELDLTHISVDKKSYLSEEYKDHYSDLVVETRFKGNSEEPVFVYFLMEHKSYIPTRPAFQLLRYMVEQWYELEKKGTLGSKLPPVFPILIYHGDKGWTPGVHFHDIVNIPHDGMKPYIPNFQYFLSDATTENEDKYKTSVVIKCWFIVVKYIKDPVMREKLFEVIKLLHDRLEQDAAVEYVDIFMKYLANTDNKVTKTDAVKAIETIFPDRGADMIKGWAKEYVEEGIEEGMLVEAREMVLEALDIRFSSNVPGDVHKKINALNNRILLKKLLGFAIQSKDIDGFRKIIQEIPSEQIQ